MQTRPFVYHLTALANIDSIRRRRVLFSAKHFLEQGGEADYMQRPRRGPRLIRVGSEVIHLRDQNPLHAGNVALGLDMTFPIFVEMLNSKVFFWPGSAASPIDYGVRHFARYVDDEVVVLRIPSKDLILSNPLVEPQVCSYNSGSPRCSGGKKSPRGWNTFVPFSRSIMRPSQVVELVYADKANLPNSTQASTQGLADFQPLF